MQLNSAGRLRLQQPQLVVVVAAGQLPGIRRGSGGRGGVGVGQLGG